MNVNTLISKAYAALDDLNNIKMVPFRDHCYGMALAEEKQHRRGAPCGHRYAEGRTPQQAARLFVVKRIAGYLCGPTSRPGIAEVLHYQPSAIYAASIVENYPDECAKALAGFDLASLAALDYVEWLKG
jgi:hypothetical protein